MVFKFLAAIVATATLIFLPGCLPAKSVPRPSGWEAHSSSLFSCPDISGAYAYFGDLASEMGTDSQLQPPTVFLGTGNQDLFAQHKMTHWRITELSGGQLEINAMSRNRSIVKEKATSKCRWGTLRLSVGKNQFDVEVTEDKALVLHSTRTDCIPFLCQNKELWMRWIRVANSSSFVSWETDAQDFIKSGCQVGKIEGCQSYLKSYPNGEFRERANLLVAAKPTSHFKNPQPIGAERRDCEVCPKMVFVPEGEFLMGYPGSPEKLAMTPHKHQVPQHPVHVEAFWMGETSITVQEWANCAKDGICKAFTAPAAEPGLPITSIDRERAQQYLNWLSNKTGKNYRLPTEAEWEYAARAGSTTLYYWGDNYQQGKVDLTNETVANYLVPAPVGAYPPNQWGLKDMGGNAYNLTSDCWHDNFEYAPPNAMSWNNDNFGDCRQSVIRGSWRTHLISAESAARSGSNMTKPQTISFRVATSAQ